MINSFSETTKVVIGALDELQDIHPFLGVAIIAFKLVVTLDLTRRENNKKVIAIQLQMQDMMCVLFQLRNMKDHTVEGPDGLTIEDRMHDLIENIARDIKECGSACDVYLKKGFLAKTLKSKIYEQRLADYAERFVDNRNNLQLAITIHMSLGVDSANEKLDKQDEQLRSIGEQLRELFRKLDTPRERDMLKFVEDNGGPRACIEENGLLEKLLKKSGETAASVALVSGRHGDELIIARKALLKELSEDLDVAFRRNMTLFEGKLDIQLGLITALGTKMSDQENHIISAIKAGSYERIQDPDLQELWKEMGWKGSVKARHFVLALRDYFADKFGFKAGATESGPNDSLVVNDQWTLSYVNIAYLQPILEAIDDDGTGFINIKEVNTFCVSCPQNWTLLQWLAYWAAGWQLNVTKYRNKIYSTVQKMMELLQFVREDNKQVVSDYLDNWMFCQLDLLLRSTKPISESVNINPELAKLARDFASSEEILLGNKLKSVLFELDSPATVSLVTGPGRIERYIYPLLHLILRRHLDRIKYSCHHILNKDEFTSAIASLTSLFTAFDDRTADLEAIYKQMHLNVKSHFQNFSFGMFLASYGDLEELYRPCDNELFSWVPDEDEEGSEDESDETDGCPSFKYISHDILSCDVQDDFQFETLEIEKSEYPEEEGSLQGLWSGHCFISNESDADMPDTEGGLLAFNIDTISESESSENNFSGKGEHYLGFFEVEGSLSNNIKDPSIPGIKISIEYADGTTLRLEGFLDVDERVITGKWYKEIVDDGDDEDDEDDEEAEEDDDDNSDEDSGTFTFTRTPPDIVRYKYTSSEFETNHARARWNFALNAIMHRVQKEIPSSWDFIKSRLVEGRKLLSLTVDSENWSMNNAPFKELTDEEWTDLESLRQRMDPADSRLYHALGVYVVQRQPFHGARSCDGCENDIIYDRYSCITCVSDDYSTCIDLCGDCINKEPTWDMFTHKISHTLLRSQHILIDARAAWLIPEAQKMSSRIKAAFSKASSTRKKPLCACCEKPITLPCWVCVECAPDLYVCENCNLTKRPVLSNGKYPEHHHLDTFMRIYDTVEVAKRDDNQLNRLERRLEAVEKNFTSLDTKLSERLSSLETLLNQLLITPREHIADRPQAISQEQQADSNVDSQVPHSERSQNTKPTSGSKGGNNRNNQQDRSRGGNKGTSGGSMNNKNRGYNNSGQRDSNEPGGRGGGSKQPQKGKSNYDGDDDDNDDDEEESNSDGSNVGHGSEEESEEEMENSGSEDDN
ncbi:hypothetical protein BDQ17DRAFT_1288362 [Cyathus striatus]|nr:hypothetical protein BDQ17DRAFT_1288362 [Cyathus striatus]